MRKTVIDEVKIGMIGIIIDGDKRINCIVNDIISHGQRIRVYVPETKNFEEFSLRKTSVLVKINHSTDDEKSPKLTFPILIRKVLHEYFYEPKRNKIRRLDNTYAMPK